MLLIYSKNITERVKFTFNLIFCDILKINYSLTDDLAFFHNSNQPKFTYGVIEGEQDVPMFGASTLLFEDTIIDHTIKVENYGELKVLFPVESDSIPYDLFASAFFLVTRYEEYLTGERDKHGRFSSKSSLAFQYDFLDKPMVNYYARFIKTILQKKFPALVFPERKFSFRSTFDIDNAYAFQYKGFVKNAGILLKKLLTIKIKKFVRQIKILMRILPDPYDSYDSILEVNAKYNIRSTFFFLLGNKSKYDRNISHTNNAVIQLIKKISLSNDIGIHPSYESNRNVELLKIEKERLESILGKPIVKSRQHYLKMKMPETYRALLQNEIKEDYTMGYACKIGFRASICNEYSFFDLERNETTALRIFPFQVMDATLKYYMKVRASKLEATIAPIFDEIKKVNGEIGVLLHNEMPGAQREWKNWKGAYEKIVSLALKQESIEIPAQ